MAAETWMPSILQVRSHSSVVAPNSGVAGEGIDSQLAWTAKGNQGDN
jgi:hypothetical protein